jgi:predicted dehydrogenase
MTTYRFALLGAGFIGSVHAANLASHPGIDFCVVYDIDTTAGVLTFARHWAPVGSGYALIASTPTSRCEPVLHPWGALQLTAC